MEKFTLPPTLSKEDREWCANQISQLPCEFHKAAAERYTAIFLETIDDPKGNGLESFALREANTWLREFLETLVSFGLSRYDVADAELVQWANEIAQLYRSLAAKSGAFAKKCEPKLFKESHWRRFLRKIYRHARELAAYHLGLVGAGKQEIVSDLGLAERGQQKQRNESSLRKLEVVFPCGSSVSLWDVSVSARVGKSAERIAIAKGLEIFSQRAGMNWSMWTLTAPPRFHPSPRFGESQWDGSSMREAHDFLNIRWKLVRARLANDDVQVVGILVAEPHRDGCPHWHLLCFYLPDDGDAIRFRLREAWGEEPAAQEVVGDPKKGTFSSYAFKYLVDWVDSIDPQSITARVDAWRSTWNIRSYRFVGLPPINVWRILRRIRDPPEDELIYQCWLAANTGNYANYLEAMGGYGIGARKRPIAVLRPSGDTAIRLVNQLSNAYIDFEKAPAQIRRRAEKASSLQLT